VRLVGKKYPPIWIKKKIKQSSYRSGKALVLNNVSESFNKGKKLGLI